MFLISMTDSGQISIHPLRPPLPQVSLKVNFTGFSFNFSSKKNMDIVRSILIIFLTSSILMLQAYDAETTEWRLITPRIQFQLQQSYSSSFSPADPGTVL